MKRFSLYILLIGMGILGGVWMIWHNHYLRTESKPLSKAEIHDAQWEDGLVQVSHTNLTYELGRGQFVTLPGDPKYPLPIRIVSTSLAFFQTGDDFERIFTKFKAQNPHVRILKVEHFKDDGPLVDFEWKK